MNTTNYLRMGILSLALILSACFREADPGPLQQGQRDYPIFDFDRLEAADGLNITIRQSPLFEVHAEGDRRNLSDLIVSKLGSTLQIKFSENWQRDHPTYITITMPVLAGANFSGASNVSAAGLTTTQPVDLTFSGASIGQFNVDARVVRLAISGASRVSMSDNSESLFATVSGASELSAYGLTTLQANIDASGASKVNVKATQKLDANASGASIIYVRGGATVNAMATGGSTVTQD
jgi:hypothetical protein